MEHVLFVVLTLLAILLWFRSTEKPLKGGALLTGLVLGLLSLTRPEGLALLFLLALMRVRAQRNWSDVARMGGVVTFFVAIELAINRHTSHSILPQTMQGRLWLALRLAGNDTHARLLCIAQWFTRFLKTWHIFSGTTFFETTSKIAIVGIALFIGIPVVVELAVIYYQGRSRITTLCLWALMLDVIYLAILPSSGQGGRYQPLQLMLALPLFFAGLYRIFARFEQRFVGRNDSYWATALTWLLILVSGAFSLTAWRGVTRADISQINQEHGSMALWLAQSLPSISRGPGKIAVFDIGRIGYELHGNLIDLGGLTDRTYLPYLKSGRVSEYLALQDADLVVLPTSGKGDLGMSSILNLGSGSTKLIEIKTFCAEPEDWRIAVLATNTATPCQSAFHLEPQTTGTGPKQP